MTDVVGRTWRPRGVIITAVFFTALFVGGTVLGWFALPPEIRARFTIAQILTLLGILAVMEIVMWLLAGSVVRADANGLTIRNGWMRRRVGWGELQQVRLRPGDPWALALLREKGPDGEPRKVVLFGLQGSEGEASRTAVKDMNAEVARRRTQHG